MLTQFVFQILLHTVAYLGLAALSVANGTPDVGPGLPTLNTPLHAHCKKGRVTSDHLWLSQLRIVFIPFQLYPCTLPLITNNYNVNLVYFTLCTWKDSDHISCLCVRCLQ